ncbi:unnamed protein product [Prorocentrum cordatum]|uniref:Uncharacterized protein n=1 Tax=Prorocentrum cordatum TaxID=2364126 RepID=A0ABN9YKK2_9DINO|nr:unnamed protein product [Polarella glacialis]
MCYIRMCDSVIRELPLYVFTSLFLKPLIRLAVDRVKNVRLCFAAAMLPHLRRVGGRLGRNRSLVLTARTKMRREDSDREVRRVLAPCTEALGVPDQDLVGPEPDWDDQAPRGRLAGARGRHGWAWPPCSGAGPPRRRCFQRRRPLPERRQQQRQGEGRPSWARGLPCPGEGLGRSRGARQRPVQAGARAAPAVAGLCAWVSLAGVSQLGPPPRQGARGFSAF